MSEPSIPHARPLTRWQRAGLALLGVSVVVSSLSLLGALGCVLMFLLTDVKTYLGVASALAGIWVGFGLLNMRIMHTDER